MRHLSIAFAGEGPTDYQFGRALVEQHVEVVLAESASDDVQIGPIVPVLDDQGRPTNQKDEVCSQFLDGHLFADVLVVHTDAGGSFERARLERVSPIEDLLANVSDELPRVVAFVPVREIEAWMLCDRGALERVLGVRPGLLSMPTKASKVGSIRDPKAALRALTEQSETGVSRRRKTRRRRGDRLEGVYANLAREVAVTRLREVPAFVHYESALRSSLTEIGFFA